MVNSGDLPNPITSICIVSDKNRCPSGYEVLAKAHDDSYAEADVWKDGMFSFSRTCRYICISRNYPPGTFVYNVVADIALINAGDLVSPGFIPLESTEDTREKALRKKVLCVRYIPRESAIDAVSDIILLVRQKKPPQGYTLAGDIDGVSMGFKYSQIPAEFGRTTGAAAVGRSNGVYPNLPYPIHPGASQGNPAPAPPPVPDRNLPRQSSSTSGPPPRSVLEGVPFQLSPAIKFGAGPDLNLPQIPRLNWDRIESDYAYVFSIEQTTLSSMNF